MKYEAHITLTNGQVLIFAGLTMRQAQAINLACLNHFNVLRSNVDIASFGWKEMK